MEEYQSMKSRILSLISILLLITLAGILLASCGSSSSPTPANTSSGSSTSAGQALMQERCSVCHALDRVTSAHKSAAEWKITVDRMIGHGAQLTPQEEQTLIDYLASNYK
jgi:uncharacterized membrane protein